MNPVERTAGTVVLATSLAFALVSMGLGSWALANLSGSYRTEDILFNDGPELFTVWLSRHSQTGTLEPAAIGRRLLAMPIAARRATTDAMMQPSFLQNVAERESERGALLKTIELGLIAALTAAPTSGELWLAAARVRTLHRGFDEKAESFLAMSYLMAPREAGLARARLVFATSVSPLLRQSFAEERLRDRDTVQATYPEFERRYRDWFESRQGERTGRPQR